MSEDNCLKLKTLWAELENVDKEIETWINNTLSDESASNNQSIIVEYFKTSLKDEWTKEIKNMQIIELINDSDLENRLISKHQNIVSSIFASIDEKITDYEASVLSINDRIRQCLHQINSNRLTSQFIPLLEKNVSILTICLRRFKDLYPVLVQPYITRDREVIHSRCSKYSST